MGQKESRSLPEITRADSNYRNDTAPNIYETSQVHLKASREIETPDRRPSLDRAGDTASPCKPAFYHPEVEWPSTKRPTLKDCDLKADQALALRRGQESTRASEASGCCCNCGAIETPPTSPNKSATKRTGIKREEETLVRITPDEMGARSSHRDRTCRKPKLRLELQVKRELTIGNHYHAPSSAAPDQLCGDIKRIEHLIKSRAKGRAAPERANPGPALDAKQQWPALPLQTRPTLLPPVSALSTAAPSESDPESGGTSATAVTTASTTAAAAAAPGPEAGLAIIPPQRDQKDSEKDTAASRSGHERDVNLAAYKATAARALADHHATHHQRSTVHGGSAPIEAATAAPLAAAAAAATVTKTRAGSAGQISEWELEKSTRRGSRAHAIEFERLLSTNGEREKDLTGISGRREEPLADEKASKREESQLAKVLGELATGEQQHEKPSLGQDQKEQQDRLVREQTNFENGLILRREPPNAPVKSANTTTRERPLAWADLASRYGRMARKSQHLVPGNATGPGGCPGTRRASSASRLRDSCFCHIFCALLQTLFPLLGAFKDYSLPGDLVADLAAGFTVAVLHIPQGMAYGLLSGVEPIYGLYVSFIPVLVMSLMSKSRHVSYGTFAIISMLLMNTIQQVRQTLQDEQTRMFSAAPNASAPANQAASLASLVLTNNHRPSDAPQHEQKDQLLRNLIGQSASQINELGAAGETEPTGGIFQVDRSVLADEQATVAGQGFAVPSNIEILSCVCIVCGVVHVTMSLMRLGILSLMFSDQLISSFTTAGAIHVLTSQLPSLFDVQLAPIESELFKCMRIWWRFTRALVYEGFNQTTGLLSLASILFLLLIKELIEPRLRARFKRLTCVPSELFLMVIVTLCSSHYNFESNFNVKIVGEVPSGLPEPRAPRLELVPYVFKDAISIALITFAMNLSIAQVYANKFRYELNANQELFALGSANIVSSFFSCFPCASSLSRSSIQSNLNVKSQLCSLFSCCIVLAIICYFAHILHDLPKSTLSCIIVVALKGILLQLRDLYDNWRLSKLDALVWILTFLSVIVFGVTYGLILGIVASVLMILLRLLTPNHSVLARLPGTDIFVDKDAFVDCEELERVKIFRFNSALCYLNRTRLKSKIEKLLPSVFEPSGFRAICAHFHARQQTFYNSTSNTRRVDHLVIDCSALSYCDYSGANTLVELIRDLETRKVTVYLAACPLKLIEMLEKIQDQRDIVGRNVFPTIGDALGQISYLRQVVVVPASLQEKGKFSLTDSSGSRESAQLQSRQASISEAQATKKRPSVLFAPRGS